ncbi:hypothetical protein V1478_000457 [Vespula squamosa]|uniref:Uncharacterized protein n=1 Tax=Vespula squamosa TaxID=30214 RepID=A0ABD2C5J9_VESSQ
MNIASALKTLYLTAIKNYFFLCKLMLHFDGVARGWGTDIACKYRNGTQYLQAMADKRMDQHLNRSSIEWWLLADEVERKHGRQEGAN